MGPDIYQAEIEEVDKHLGASPFPRKGCYHCKHGTERCICPKSAKVREASANAEMANLLVAADQGLIGPGGVVTSDQVTLPHHYARFKIEPIRFIGDNGLNWFQGNILKYIMRWDAKNGLEDLKKAKRYLEMFIKFVEGDPNWWGRDPKEATA